MKQRKNIFIIGIFIMSLGLGLRAWTNLAHNILAVTLVQFELGVLLVDTDDYSMQFAHGLTKAGRMSDERLARIANRLWTKNSCYLKLGLHGVFLTPELLDQLMDGQIYKIQQAKTDLWLVPDSTKTDTCQYKSPSIVHRGGSYYSLLGTPSSFDKRGELREFNRNTEMSKDLRQERLANKILVQNLVRNGNFEWFLEREGMTVFSYFHQIYSSDPNRFRVRIGHRAGQETAMAVLSGEGPIPRGSGANSGLITSPILVTPGDHYLFGGWVRTQPGARSSIWLSLYPESRMGRVDGFMQSSSSWSYCTDDGWQFMAGFLQTQEEAHSARIWLTNTDGKSEFSDIFLISIFENIVKLK